MDKERVALVMGSIVGKENIRIDEPMKNHTSFKVGGPADVMVIPDDTEKLISVYKFCREMDIPVFVMGNGTNLLVKDGGIRGVVIKIAGNLSSYKVSDGIIRAQAGTPISEISRVALENSLSGIEFAEGIPGTLGGAIAMNAGAYNGEISDVVFKTEYLDADGSIKVLTGKEHMFGKRTSFIQEHGGVVIASELKLKEGNKAEIREMMDEFNRQRKEKQPLDMPSAGSIFKRPEGFFAGKLIEDCGLKGARIGGAEVSSKHCGFIINNGGATAEDILKLIRHIQQNVRMKFGVELQTEVKIIGEEQEGF